MVNQYRPRCFAVSNAIYLCIVSSLLILPFPVARLYHMFEFHKDLKSYFDFNAANAAQYILPFITEKFALREGMRVLDIGCGEGAILKTFIDRGCTGLGVELNPARIEQASQ